MSYSFGSVVFTKPIKNCSVKYNKKQTANKNICKIHFKSPYLIKLSPVQDGAQA